MTNLSRVDLLKLAQETLDKFNGAARVYFKYTCDNCSNRVTLCDPNILYERGECNVCGHEQDIVEGGILLEIIPVGVNSND